MTLELIFRNAETDYIRFAITDIVVIRWITPSEIGFTMLDGRLGRCKFNTDEKLEILRKER